MQKRNDNALDGVLSAMSPKRKVKLYSSMMRDEMPVSFLERRRGEKVRWGEWWGGVERKAVKGRGEG